MVPDRIGLVGVASLRGKHTTPLKPMIKSLLIGASVSCAMAGISCFAVLMHDVDRSLVTNRPGLNSEQISLLALAALIAPAVGVIPLHAANRLQD